MFLLYFSSYILIKKSATMRAKFINVRDNVMYTLFESLLGGNHALSARIVNELLQTSLQVLGKLCKA